MAVLAVLCALLLARAASAELLKPQVLLEKDGSSLSLIEPSSPDAQMAVIFGPVQPCVAVSQPHTHPKSDELLLAEEGQIWVGTVNATSGKFVEATLKPGQMFNVPAGWLHSVINKSCKRAVVRAFFMHNEYDSVFPLELANKFPKDVMSDYFLDSKLVIQPGAGPFFQQDAECIAACKKGAAGHR